MTLRSPLSSSLGHVQQMFEVILCCEAGEGVGYQNVHDFILLK